MKRLFIICLVLLLCAPVYATKVSSRDDSTAIASMQTDVDSLLLLTADALSTNKVAGDVFYVDSGASGGSGTGVDWTNAELTIEAAIANCTAGAGDWIMVSPTHAETAATAFVDLDKTDVTLWGLGNGTRMATLTYDTSTDTFIIGAGGDGTKVHGIKFIAAVTAVANAVVVEAGCTDFVIENCVFENVTTTTDEFIDAILVSGTASDRGIIRNNRFLGDVGANGGPQSSINFVDCDYLQIIGNEFSGDIADAHIFNETTASNFITIKDNRIICGYIGDAATVLDTTPGISLVATTTGWIMDNTIVTNVVSNQASIVAADCYVFGNRYRELQGNTLEVGKVYTLIKDETIMTGATDDLFTVAGGAIEIVSMFGQINTVIGGAPGDVSINVVATIGTTHNADFSVDVTLTDTQLGDVVTFITISGGENAGDATANENAGIPLSWFCPAGIIQQTLTSTGTGGIKWYMSFRALEEGVTVVVQ